MPRRWHLVGYVGNNLSGFEDWLPGKVKHRQVEEALRRLHARHLDERQVVKAIRDGTDRSWVETRYVGDNQGYVTTDKANFYTADYEEYS